MEDGYHVDIVSGHLVLRDVPYVNANREVKRGILVSVLDLAGDVTIPPTTHVVMFGGEYPCDHHGQELTRLQYASERQELADGLVVDYSFSNKPPDGYADYFEKMTTYATIISGHAEAIDASATARPRRVLESNPDDDTVFSYLDTASSRAGIDPVSAKLKGYRIAIVGVGGTGSYVLDLVAKTHVREIHLFDGDDFLQHNAFRSPGAPSLEELMAVPKKVHHHARHYGRMRRTGIVEHAVSLDASNVDELQGMDFVFICVDRGEAKRPIVEKLEALGTPFIDVGMGIQLVEGRLHGVVRVTTSTPTKREHVRSKRRIALSGGDVDDVYSRNIQIADLNALNAALAVIKWKKLVAFYCDLENEHFSVYTLDGNCINNEDMA